MTTDELLKLCEAAQIGPWRYNPAGAIVFGATDDTYIADIRGWGLCERLYGTTKAMAMLDANGQFIAAAREHFPACVRRVKELTAALAEAEAIIEAASAVDVIHFDGDETGHSQINVDRAASEQRLHDLLAARREKGGAK